MDRLIAALLLIIGAAACTPNAARLTVINHGAADIKINIDERPHALKAGAFLNLDNQKAGVHYLKIANAPIQTITLEPKRTTVVDVTGDGCYAVVNYTSQYEQTRGGAVVIEERFKKQPIFTTQNPITVSFGDPLPHKIDVGSHVRRLQVVDCSIIEVDRAIVEAVSRLP